ncbi:MAG: hypothetical protein QGI06_01570 [Rhodospirillales bacterium]|jgi:hypothetical protein|nr:hypothetical protein [Rhodospirillales bacterium]
MRKNLKTVIVASALAVAMLSGTALYAHQSDGSQGSMMGQGGMMGQMSQMMATCNQMMQGMMRHHRDKLPKHDQGPENKD